MYQQLQQSAHPKAFGHDSQRKTQDCVRFMVIALIITHILFHSSNVLYRLDRYPQKTSFPKSFFQPIDFSSYIVFVYSCSSTMFLEALSSVKEDIPSQHQQFQCYDLSNALIDQ